MSKLLIGLTLVLSLCACNTTAGLVTGMGEDLQQAGAWIKSK